MIWTENPSQYDFRRYTFSLYRSVSRCVRPCMSLCVYVRLSVAVILPSIAAEADTDFLLKLTHLFLSCWFVQQATVSTVWASFAIFFVNLHTSYSLHQVHGYLAVFTERLLSWAEAWQLTLVADSVQYMLKK